MKKILEIKDLHINFSIHKNTIHALRGVNFSVYEDEIIGIVGESGCGKSICTQSIVKLLPSSAKYEKGNIYFENYDLFKFSKKNILAFRGSKIGYIFQDPMVSLNPTMKIGKQILEALKIKKKEKVFELLNLVGIKNPKESYFQYPYEFSGGQKQRIMIAIAIAMKPKILIADEPTTSLDVVIQNQILDLLKKIQKKSKSSIIFISHDIKVIKSLASRILIMYAGKIIEEGPSGEIMKNPKHPYTKLLLASIPSIYSSEKLKTIKGYPPDIFKKINYCAFAERCPFVKDICLKKEPLCFKFKQRKVACWLYG